MKSGKWSDDDLVNHINDGGVKRKKALAAIYQNQVLQRRVYNMVKYRGGSESEAHELFIESVVLLDRNIRSGKFQRASSLDTYLFSISKFTWNNWVRKKKRSLKSIALDETAFEISDHQNPELQYITEELSAGLEKLIDLLSEKCRLILKMWSNNAKYDEIAEKLGVEKGGALRKQKLTCIRKLKKYLLENPNLIPNHYHGGV